MVVRREHRLRKASGAEWSSGFDDLSHSSRSQQSSKRPSRTSFETQRRSPVKFVLFARDASTTLPAPALALCNIHVSYSLFYLICTSTNTILMRRVFINILVHIQYSSYSSSYLKLTVTVLC